MDLQYVTDQSTGIAIVRSAWLPGVPKLSGRGVITYRCHTCGHLIPKDWEVFFVAPDGSWASYVLPPVMPPGMTTHHDWHMAATQRED